MQLPENNRDAEQETLAAPPELVSALKRSPKAPIFIPPSLDESILRSARQHLSRPKERKFKWSLMVRWGVATATLVLLLALLSQFLKKPGSSPGAGLAQGGLNHDGQIDILDAFALARELKAGAPPNPKLDVNGDGVVDERDVATLAARAVSLGKGGRS